MIPSPSRQIGAKTRKLPNIRGVGSSRRARSKKSGAFADQTRLFDTPNNWRVEICPRLTSDIILLGPKGRLTSADLNSASLFKAGDPF